MTQEEIMKLGDNYQYSIATGRLFNFGKGADAFRGIQTILNLGILSSPLDQLSIKPYGPDSPSSMSQVAACTSIYKLDEITKAAVAVSGYYGSASGSVAASYARNLSISETSTSYIAFFRKSPGRVRLNPDAKLTDDAATLLKTDAKGFIEKYGKLYVSGYELSSMFFGEVKIDAASMSDKVKMDLAVTASYKSILNVNGNFESDLQKSHAKYSLSVSANAIGTNVPISGITTVKEMAAVVEKIEKEFDPKDTTITEVTLSSWMHLADFVKHLKKEDVHLFETKLSNSQMDLFAANYDRLEWMAKFTDDCIKNIDGKLVRQWKVTDKPERIQKLTDARTFANEWIDKLSRVTEAEIIVPDYISKMTVGINNTQDSKITPALKIDPFMFKIALTVASDYDDYNPKEWDNMQLKVDPNAQISVIEAIIDIDNHHDNCRHFHGHQHAKFTDGAQGKDGSVIKPKIEFGTWWDRTCGGTGWSNWATFTEDLKGSCQLDYNNTVRVKLDYEVIFGQVTQLPSGLDDGVMEEAFIFAI